MASAAELFVRARARVWIDASGALRSSEGATSLSRMDWRRARTPPGTGMAVSWLELKLGPVGDAAFVRRHVRRGSWMNWIC
jgi:hypothetical protein